ncbi:alpha/beta fold hydrolase [Planktotalea sp.]|uniref:alpha/beta fold hydrolase n=1 Tax=Planktotalea sp. TaxID=2029877 RepID=UPI00329A3756
MAEFLLVHGSCHGAWCWRDLISELEALGHSARALDLPSHGNDQTPVSEVTLERYRDAILGAIEGRVHLVGHSMAGFPIAAAADVSPEKIARLIYLCAYAPMSGTSLADMRKMAKRQFLVDAIVKNADGSSWTVIPERIRDLFYHDCSDEAVAFAMERLRPQAIKPTAQILNLGADYESVAKSYIRCAEDRTIDPDFQTEMAARFAPKERFAMQTSHSPFFSDPKGLAQLLDKIAQPR